MNVAFDRIEKAWMTVSGGGDDERVEWPEPIYELEEILRAPIGETACQKRERSFQ